ncbi:sigma-70 family RNA polymerase sigma factor [Anoxybacteroides tepidamans]|uniref:sigma-70 family RNA polymerase sigma factor n=1 Tax=Anoxybacteroides tepidamans TaxID=265948 RepID=UPI000480E275|nr:sigma-70 family RNA polymerase sigma factor [Anoxybacillus tepidamans]
MSLAEEHLVQRIKARNEEAISYMLQTYGGLLKAVIRKYLHGNQQDMEECLADVLVSVWFHIDSFDPAKNEFKQWVAAIAKYKAIDYARRSKKQKLYESRFEWNERLPGPSASESCMSHLESLMHELSDVERDIFKKYYVEGVPTKEIAAQFETRESWVHNKLSRGRKKLRSILLREEV